MQSKTTLTGIKPTGAPHLGNLVGAIKPVIELANQSTKSFVFIADLHALNNVHEGEQIKQNTYEITATFLSLGLDLSKTVLFRQSDIPEVFALATLLQNVTAKGLMNRAHAYKAASTKNIESGNDADAGINMGLFNYPILMAADILLYDADTVPVGQDQKQHVEFARDIAGSFNHRYGKDVLILPEPVIQQDTKTIPGLDGRKMSKSYQNTIPIFAEPKAMEKLVKKIVSDSKRPEEPKDPNESTIFQLYKSFADTEQIEFMRQKFTEGGMGYGDAKALLFQSIEATLASPRAKYQELMSNPTALEKVLNEGADSARATAKPVLSRVMQTMLG